MTSKITALVAWLICLPLLANEQFEVIEVRAKSNQLLSNKLLVNNIDSEDIANATTIKPTMADYMAQHPSISLVGQGGLLQSYSIRGFSRARIRTEVEGVPIITDRRAGNSASFINPFFIDRVDIQTGPASTLYGSEAMGGVINLVASDFDNKQITYSLQTNDQRQNIAGLYGNEYWQYGLAYQKANNAESSNGKTLNTAFEQISGLFKYRQQYQSYLVESSWLPTLGNNIGKSSSLYPDEQVVNYPEDNHSLFQLSVTHQQDWFLKLYHHYQNWDTDTLRIKSGRNLTAYQGHTLGGLVLWKFPLITEDSRIGLDWTSRRGVSISEEEQAFNGSINYATQLVDGQQDNLALYSDWYWQIKSLQLSAGVRYDYIHQTEFINNQSKIDNNVSANFSIAMPIDSHSLQLEFASGFRFPTLSELFFSGETPRGTTIGNVDLLPERSLGAQLSGRLSLSSNLSASFATYYYQLDDYIERYHIADNVRSYRNLAQADLYGAELEVNWQVNDSLQLDFSAQRQFGENNDDENLSDIMPAKVSWSTHWYWQDHTLENDFIWALNQEHIGTGEVKRDSYFLWNFSFSSKLSPEISLAVYGENLTDEIAYATADEDAPQIIGRTIGMKFVWQPSD
ncbi:TonB-dependent receptor [Thalassotalea sp. M1531]|uniref:TonB-dependent receptor n=1 Tax=Thalassotalea algicola TaxID=2716224 RepID=A0A7Y0L8Q0_9GAMM|nr:TonB-dependent receptor [Thalassotalea algicola]NMP30013.1 TonB-dependent receptor [Thalassotalea algicola]